jgi:dimethylhistidine N-methyltransferase
MLIHTITPVRETDFAAEVRAGLSKRGQKELPSKFLYDEVGSALFEVICVLPEYGLCRAGSRLLRRHAGDIVERLQSPTVVAELGSGSGKKTRYVLEALARRQRTTYYPIDISATALEQCERELRQLDLVSVVGFERAYLDGLLEVAARRNANEQILVLFLGSTIGNFDRPAGNSFLRDVRAILRKNDCLLLATDLVKPISELLLAYDDPAGVTAAFNMNLLARINRELGANFDLSAFAHEARWNDADRRIEMHLRSRRNQTVTISGARVRVEFLEGETIWTESSHKYDVQEVVRMASDTGFWCEAQWVDQEWPFAQSLLRAV